MSERAVVTRMRAIGAGSKYGRGWATWIEDRNDLHCTSGTFSTHPTHAAALAHALAEVGLTENTEKENPMEHDDQQCSNPDTLCDDCLCYGAQENR